MTSRMAWRQWATVVLMALVVSLSFQGSRGLYDTTETRYATCAREMRTTGEWLAPTLDGKPHWTKPPLTYWAISAGTAVLGDTEWGVRLYSALAFTLTVLAIIWIGTRLFDSRTGTVAGLIFTSAPFPVLAAYVVSADMLLTCLMTLGVACFLEASQSRRDRTTRWLCLMWFFFGLGFFTKGPAACVPLIALTLWNKRQTSPIQLWNPLGLVIFCVTAFWWYVAITLKNPGLLTILVQTEIVDRISSTSVHNPAFWKAFTLYAPLLTVGLGYWLVPLVRLLRCAGPTLRHALARPDASGVLVAWALSGVVLFSLISSKLHLYVLPYVVPLTLLIARFVATRDFRTLRVWRAGITSVLCLILIKGILATVPHRHDVRGLLDYVYSIPGVTTASPLVQINHPNKFGLSYYAPGNLERWPLRYSDANGLDIVQKRLMEIDPASPPMVIIADSLDMHRLGRFMTDNQISFEQYNPTTPTNTGHASIPILNMLDGVALYDRGIYVVRGRKP